MICEKEFQNIKVFDVLDEKDYINILKRLEKDFPRFRDFDEDYYINFIGFNKNKVTFSENVIKYVSHTISGGYGIIFKTGKKNIYNSQCVERCVKTDELKQNELRQDVKNIKTIKTIKKISDFTESNSVVELDQKEPYCIKLIFTSDLYEYLIPLELMKRLSNLKEYLNFIHIPEGVMHNLNLSGFLSAFNLHIIIIKYIDYINNKKFNKNAIEEIMSDKELFTNYDMIEHIYNKNFRRNYKENDTIKTNSTKFLNNSYQLYSYIFSKYTRLYSKLILIENFHHITRCVKRVNIDKDLKGSLIISKYAFGVSTKVKLDMFGNLSENGMNGYEVDKDIYRVLVLQTFLFILVTNIYNNYFIHNDLKQDNILVFKKNEPLILQFEKYTITFDEKYIFKINDFDFVKISKKTNNKIKDSSYEKTVPWFSDVFYFCTMLPTYEKNIKKIDKELYLELKKTFLVEKYKKYSKKNIYTADVKNTHYPNISILKKFLFNSGLFSKWIK